MGERPFSSGAWRQFYLVRSSNNADLKVASTHLSIWRDAPIEVTEGEIYWGLLNLWKLDTLCDITKQVPNNKFLFFRHGGKAFNAEICR